MAAQTGEQIIAIHVLPNIPKSKGSPAMNFGQLTKFNMRKIFFKTHAENEAGRLVPGLFFFLKKKALFKVRASSQLFSFNIFC